MTHRIRRMVTPLAFSSALSLVTLGCSAEQAVTDNDTWELTFSDEFDGDAVDTTKWDVLHRKNSHNNEKQYYLPEQATVADGILRITAVDEPYDGKDYCSARLESTFTQAYGKFEIRAKLPTTKGLWPAIWLLPRGVRWPSVRWMRRRVGVMRRCGRACRR